MSPWVRWSCTYCDQGVGLRANSKAQPWHHCPRKMGKWLPLTKETNDQTNPGRCDPAGSSPGSDARAKRSAQPGGDVIRHVGHPSTSNDVRALFDVTRFSDIARSNAKLIQHDRPDYLPTGAVIEDGWLITRGDRPSYIARHRDALARAGGWRDFAHFLEWCGEIAP